MKKTLCLLLALVMAAGLLVGCGSNNEEEQKEERERNGEAVVVASYKVKLNGADYASIICEYDKDGNLSSQLRKGFDSTGDQKYTFKFDEKGYETERAVYLNNEEQYTIARKYDEQGRVIELVESVDGKVASKKTYKFDKNGNVTEETAVLGKSQDSRTVTVFNGEGNIEKIENYSFGQLSGYVVYSYDGTGKLVQTCEYSVMENGGVKGVVDSIEGENGENVEVENADGNVDVTEAEVKKVVYEYGADNKLSSTVIYEQGMEFERTEYKYDEKGRVTETYSSALGEEGIRTTLAYDEKDRIVERVEDHPGEVAVRNAYTFDADGRTVEQYYGFYDGMSLSEYTLTTQYGEDGLLVSQTKTMGDGNCYTIELEYKTVKVYEEHVDKIAFEQKGIIAAFSTVWESVQ